MDQKEILKKVFAALFFICGVALLITVVFIVGLRHGVAEKKFSTVVLFKNVSGLNTGAPVRLSGINVGMVDDISFLDEEYKGRSIKVTLNIFKKYEKQFNKCARVAVKTEGVLGEKYIDISEDAVRKSFPKDHPIIGEEPLDVEDMADVMTETAVSLKRATDNVNSMIKEFHYISKRSRRILNRLEQQIVDGKLFKLF